MAIPVQTAPDRFFHQTLTVGKDQVVSPYTPTPLRQGVWITLDTRDFYVSLTPGSLAETPANGLLLKRNTGPYFFPCTEASLLTVRSTGNNGVIRIMAG